MPQSDQPTRLPWKGNAALRKENEELKRELEAARTHATITARAARTHLQSETLAARAAATRPATAAEHPAISEARRLDEVYAAMKAAPTLSEKQRIYHAHRSLFRDSHKIHRRADIARKQSQT